MTTTLQRDACPICACREFTLPRPDLQPHPYQACSACGFYYQAQLIDKVYEGFHEMPGDTMSQHERDVNQYLANTFNSWFPAQSEAPAPKTCLDIGSKYPWLSHCLGLLGWQSYAIDGIPEILQFTQAEQLHVTSFQCDFEKHSQSGQAWPWDQGLATPMQFDFISIIHVIEHFYFPLAALKAIFDLLKPDGILFVRCPDSQADGVERDFTEGHYTIHPQIWCLDALQLAAHKTGFTIKETWPMYGQRDIVLRKPATNSMPDDYYQAMQVSAKLNLGVGMIVKNEQDDLPACLESVGAIADLMCIIDTGSTDRTLEIIQIWADRAGWQVALDRVPPQLLPKTVLLRRYFGASEQDAGGDWKLWNFGQARNQYVQTLDRLVNWILWMDADDVLLQPEQLPPLLHYQNDVFGFGIVDRAEHYSTRFIHHRLWRTGLGIHYQGACHEYPYWPRHTRLLSTELNIHHRWTSNPHQELGPSRNLRILQREYANGQRSLRVLFYLGNTLKDAGQYQAAIDIYAEYLAQKPGYWDEHVFCMLYKMRCERQLAYQNGDYAAFFTSGFEALAQDQRFSEISMELAYAYFDLGQWHKSIAFCEFSLQEMPKTDLFIEPDKYTDQPHRIMARCYQQLGKWQSAVDHTCEVLKFVPNDVDMQNQAKTWAQAMSGPLECHVNRPGAAGDIVLTLHALERYKALHPTCKIIYYCAPQFKEIPRISSAVSEVRDSANFVAQGLLHSVNLIGYPFAEGYPDQPMQHNLVDYFAREMGLPPVAEVGFEPQFPAISNPALQALVGQNIITLHCQAGWSPYKNWPIERWHGLIEKMRADPACAHYQLVQIGAASDPALANVIDLRGKLSLVESMQAIKLARLHVGVDSFSNHATALLPYTPAVILWGSTSPIGSGYAHNTNIWKKDIGCSPCYREYDAMSVNPKGKCPLDPTQSWENPQHPCMTGISVDEVLAAVLARLLDRV